MNASSNFEDSDPLFNSTPSPAFPKFNFPAETRALPPSADDPGTISAADPFINLSDISEPPNPMPNTFTTAQIDKQRFNPLPGSDDQARHSHGQSQPKTESKTAASQPQDSSHASLAPAPVFSPLRSADEIHATLNEFRDILDSIESGNRVGAPNSDSTAALDQVNSMLPAAPVFPDTPTADAAYATLESYRGVLDSIEENSTPSPPSAPHTNSPSSLFPSTASAGEIYNTLDGFRGILDTLEDNAIPAPTTPELGTPELGSPNPIFPASASTDEIYQTLDGFRGILDSIDNSTHPHPNDPTPAPPSQPTVEIIEATAPSEDNVDRPDANLNRASSDTQNQEYSFVTLPLTLEKSILDSLVEIGKINEHSLIVTPLYLPSNQTSSNLDAEPEADIRDFSDAASGQIEPIPGSCDLPPDAFDFQTLDAAIQSVSSESELDRVAPTLSTPAPAKKPHAEPTQELQGDDSAEVFLAKSGDVIEIDGKNGFDHIDLQYFNVESASFSGNCIKIDDQVNPSFEIRHRNIQIARFANSVEIDLFSVGQ